MILESKKTALLILGLLLFANAFAWIIILKISNPKILEVCFFDVGQGDAIFIKTLQGHQILVDGGPDSKILEKLSQEMPFYDRSIDLLILSHPEKDHMAGLIQVLKNYKVDYILWTGVVRNTIEYQEWIKALNKEQEQGAEIKIAQANQQITASRTTLNIMHPLENLAGKEHKDSNNTSIVVKLIFGENSFLFTGDIYSSKEAELIEQGAALNSDVLKIAHHGSKTSTNNEFVQEVSPKIGVIQCKKDNSYGHPHEQTLETLKKYNVEVLRTDESGDIKIISNGQTYQIF